jgi:hypothetical protein
MHYTTHIKIKDFQYANIPQSELLKTHVQELLVFSGQRGGFLPGKLLTLDALEKVHH